jgi:hypothetical protein
VPRSPAARKAAADRDTARHRAALNRTGDVWEVLPNPNQNQKFHCSLTSIFKLNNVNLLKFVKERDIGIIPRIARFCTED